ncbi:hypothetical protein Q7P37_004624 [Cladosporium fusiforme]
MFRLNWRILFLFFTFLFLSLAASPTSFCKCTCFSNSTIIPLSSKPSENKQTPAKPPSSLFDIRAPSEQPAHRSCADCTKQFCLSYNLPICSKAKEEDVSTICFQRDSAKDQAVVLLFIGATVGLLLWAAVRPAYERWSERRGYTGVAGGNGGGLVGVYSMAGKSASIIFDDCDIPNTVQHNSEFFLRNSGHLCFAASRALVQEIIATDFT